MTGALTDGLTDLEILEGLDFDPELPCEWAGHPRFHKGGPARYFVAQECPHCDWHHESLLCEYGYANPPDVWCRGCRKSSPKSQVLTILRDLKA